MITDADINKMKKVFATKEDLVAMEKRQDAKFATKDDMKSELSAMEKRQDEKFVTKSDLKSELSAMEKRQDAKYAMKDEMDSGFASIKKTLRAMNKKLDLVIRYFDQQTTDHGKRIKRIEHHLNLPVFAY